MANKSRPYTVNPGREIAKQAQNVAPIHWKAALEVLDHLNATRLG